MVSLFFLEIEKADFSDERAQERGDQIERNEHKHGSEYERQFCACSAQYYEAEHEHYEVQAEVDDTFRRVGEFFAIKDIKRKTVYHREEQELKKRIERWCIVCAEAIRKEKHR